MRSRFRFVIPVRARGTDAVRIQGFDPIPLFIHDGCVQRKVRNVVVFEKFYRSRTGDIVERVQVFGESRLAVA